jgi:hypothetical protein
LAVDQNGDLTVPHHLTAENGQVSTNTGCDGNAGMTVGGVYIWTDPTCGPGDTGIYFQNPGGEADYQFSDQGDYMTIWGGPHADSIFKAHENGEWDSEEGGFLLSGAGNTAEEMGDQGWGFQPQYNTGWSMVTQDGAGVLNVQPGIANGSVDVNDIDVRSGGAYPWYSQLSNQVYSDTQQLSQQGNQINNLNNEYSSQQGQISNNTSSISSINSNLNQTINTANGTAAPYAALQSLCSAVATAGAAQIGQPEDCGGGVTGAPTQCGPVGPVTYSYSGYCYNYRFHYRYPCTQYGTSPPTVNLPLERNYPQLVVAAATAGIGQSGCTGSSSSTGVLTLTATSGGAQLAQSASYSKGGSNYNPITMYFPFSITFVLPAGQSGQIQLTGGRNNLGCGTFSYSLYRL